MYIDRRKRAKSALSALSNFVKPSPSYVVRRFTLLTDSHFPTHSRKFLQCILLALQIETVWKVSGVLLNYLQSALHVSRCCT